MTLTSAPTGAGAVRDDRTGLGVLPRLALAGRAGAQPTTAVPLDVKRGSVHYFHEMAVAGDR